MIADTVIPRLNKLVIYGLLEFDHGPVNSYYRNFTVSATDIIIVGGNLLIGSPDAPFLGEIDIILRGQRPGYSDTVEYLPNTDVPVNSKTIAVYGGLEMHGKDVGISWTRLATTGNPGDNSITLSNSVSWGVGEEIVITPTSYDIWETETFKITGVSDDGFTLTLNASLLFRHIAHEETITGRRVIMSAEVGLLTRNIRVVGEDEDAMYRDSYGGRIVVGVTMANDALINGFARFSNVEFYHTGQRRWNFLSDKSHSLIYLNAGTVTTVSPSSVTKCVFHHGFSSAIGVFGTNGLALTDNVIHHTWSIAIETQAFRTTIQGNLVNLVRDSSSYSGAISGIASRELILRDNTVSGTNGVAFRIAGIECGVTSGPSGNEAHSSSIGLAVFPEDSVQGSCHELSNFFIWKCNNFGIYYNNRLSVVLTNNILAENVLGLYTQVIGPSAEDHLYSKKYCTVKNSLIIGTTSSYNCTTDQDQSTAINSQITGGHVGLTFTSFMGGTNGAPEYDLTAIRTYPAIMGVTNIKNVTFAHFKTVCGTRDVMLTTNKANDDGQHPVVTSGITKYDTENDTYFFIHRPNIEKINPSDCVDMDCDGLKKALIKDEDGSFLGRKGAVVSQSEWEWGGDPRRGLGDYRIPREMLTTLSGERVNVSSIAPHKGIIRNDQCLYRTTWQAYECHDLDYGMLIIESLDADTETRRLSPVAILGDGYLDLINGPQDHSGCSLGSCRRRLSTFMSIVATGTPYLLHFTTTSPQTMRLFLLNSNDNQAVTLKIWYSQSNRRDVYVNDELVLAKNARMVNGKYIVDPPSFDNEFVPDVNSKEVSGTNFFDRDSNILYVLVRGDSPVKIVTNPSFIVSFQIPALTPEEFYGEALIHNLALFFDVPPEKIRVVNVVRESERRRRRRDVEEDIEIQVEISDPPTATGNATVNETMTADSLRNMSAKFLNEVQGGGDISKALNVSVKGLRISGPLPEVREDGNYETVPSAGKVTVPDSMRIFIQPTMGYEKLPFATQPCLQVFDVQEDPMALVGAEDDPWLVTANLVSETPRSAQLLGNMTVKIINGWANFTDLRISHYGENFYIQFNKTYPENAIDLINRTAYFTVNKLDTSLRISVLKDKIIQNNATEVKIELFNKATGQQIKHLDMMGLNWTASVQLSNVAEPPGNMTGHRDVTFDPATGEAVFDNLSFDQIGTYILEFAVMSLSEDYIINENVPVDVVNEKQLELLDSNTTLVSKVSLTFNENFQNIVGNKTDEFGAYIVNILRLEHRNVLFENVTVTEGSIVVGAVIRASPVDMNSTLGLLSETIEANNFTFNGFQLRSPTLHADEKLQTTATTNQVSTTGTTQIMTTGNIVSTTFETAAPFETTTTFETTRTFETTPTFETTTFETTPTFETTTSETTTTTVSSAAVLSFPVVVVIVVTPLAILLGVIFIVILLKYRKSQKPEMREHLTRPPAVSSDDFIPRKNKTSNEYSYLSPFSIGAHTKPQQHQISRLHSSLVLRPYTPTYEIQNQLPPSAVGSLGSATSENYRRRQFQSSGSDIGYLSRNNGERQ